MLELVDALEELVCLGSLAMPRGFDLGGGELKCRESCGYSLGFESELVLDGFGGDFERGEGGLRRSERGLANYTSEKLPGKYPSEITWIEASD